MLTAAILHLGDGAQAALSSAVWFAVSALVGFWATRWPAERVSRPGPVTGLRAWERRGDVWQRWLRVNRWKDRVPEAGGIFGGEPKRKVRSRRTEDLARYRGETIRAERVHWLILASTPLHLLWCRPTVAAGMVAFGLAFNLPFVVIQRHNRARLDRLLARRSSA